MLQTILKLIEAQKQKRQFKYYLKANLQNAIYDQLAILQKLERENLDCYSSKENYQEIEMISSSIEKLVNSYNTVDKL